MQNQGRDTYNIEMKGESVVVNLFLRVEGENNWRGGKMKREERFRCAVLWSGLPLWGLLWKL